MGRVQVIAKKTGYFDHKRIKEGSVFFMDEEFLKMKDGKLISPTWVQVVDKDKEDRKPKGKSESKISEDVI